ncbi:hypothetical protein FH966_15215 [Lentibacillus cibarius]|uniref:Uncharacterized protein n=1 Tax=Lentibacillus cibarius TaxID=2583219 RepID=A0A549YM38_9BACI|nr:hypothetical protein [Lentibacillus cibarius]TMN21166.1 hypothetical protein FFL34_02860 [Lentibacillus cibarius]TRM12946.1 hypothetical protein FH966_15215 [Lentibacillus cibarius]
MRHYAVLRLLLAGFFLYIAWPAIPTVVTLEATIFWGLWLGFFLLVVGSNLASLLQMVSPPVMEQESTRQRQNA